MSVAELAIPIQKSPGAACGFTLLRNSCTVNKVVDGVDMRPGDVILAIDDTEVSPESIREILRQTRDKTEVTVIVARSLEADYRVFGDQAQALGIISPQRKGVFCCLFSKKEEITENAMLTMIKQRRKSSIGSQLDSTSPKGNCSSLSSLGSTGVRPVDLRKLRKEGAAAMWKAGRNSSEAGTENNPQNKEY